MKKAILIGASSGIGKDLATELAARGYELGICARRTELLEELAKQLPTKTLVKRMDTAQHEESRAALSEMMTAMPGVDIIIYNAGIGDSSGKWEKENGLLQVNVLGFAAIANWTFKHFRDNKIRGQIVGVTSVAGTRGMRHAISYSASKAFMTNYMQGQRHKSVAEKLGITITDVRPGFIDTDMTKGQKGMFMVQTSQKAARQIADAIEARKDVAYITKRWWLFAKLYALFPDFIWNRT